MKAAGGVLGLVIVLAIVWFVVRSEFATGPGGTVEPPAETINTAGVRSDLLSIAQAERMYMASHGSYVSIDDLQQDGSLSFSGAGRRGYTYTSEVDDGQHFKITGTPSDPAKAHWPTISIDESMQITQQ
jgi:hypothetical protein